MNVSGTCSHCCQWYRPSLCPWLIVWRTELLLKLQQLDLNNDALKLETWSLGLVVFKHSQWNSSQSAKWQIWRFQIQDLLMILFLWNYLILYMSDWITSKSDFKGGYMFCNFFIENSQISHFGHLSFTLKSPPMNADHHPCFLLISPYFIAMFHLEMLFFP